MSWPLRMPDSLRTVVFDHAARAALLGLYNGKERLADEAIRGFEFILSRSPESGCHIEGNIWMIEMAGIGIWQAAVAYYSFDANTVTVHDVVKM